VDINTKEILRHYYRGSPITSAIFENEGSRLILTLQCRSECPDDALLYTPAYTHRLVFDGVLYHVMESRSDGENMPLCFLTGDFPDTGRKRNAEIQHGSPLLHYAIHLRPGYAEILCRNIELHSPAALPVLPPPDTSLPQKILSAAECARLITSLSYGMSVSVVTVNRLRRTLETMAETREEQLLSILRRLLALPTPPLLAVSARLIAQCGTKEDLPLLYAHLPRTERRPDLRHALLDAADMLANK